MRIPRIIIILSLLVVASCSSVSQKYANDYYEEGIVFYEQMEYARSVESFNKVLELEPNGKDNYKVYYNRGVAFLKNRQFTQAIYDFTKALELVPARQKQMRYLILESRGNALQDIGQIDASVDDYTSAIDLIPRQQKNQYLYNNRGWSWISKQNYDAAIDDFNMALDRDADFASAYYGRAMAWYKKGDYQQATIDAKNAVRLEPGKKEYDDLLFDIRTAMKKE